MSSESDKLIWQEMISQAKRETQTAGKTVPCVSVTEQNWAAVIGALQKHTQLLEMVLTHLERLTTKEQMVSFMNRQLDFLQEDAQKNAEVTRDLQKKLQLQAEAMCREQTKMLENLDTQAGKMSEQFGSGLTEERQRMRKFTVRTFWISLIPTALCLLSAVLLVWLRT